jgi:hypothetical protein
MRVETNFNSNWVYVQTRLTVDQLRISNPQVDFVTHAFVKERSAPGRGGKARTNSCWVVEIDGDAVETVSS